MKMKVMLMAFAIVTIAAAYANAGLVFSDDFSGTSADLNGAAPDVRPGSETWVAALIFNQDGSLDGFRGSATLAFTPLNGYIYTLDASLTGVSGDTNWIALGFARGQSTGTGTTDRFITGNVMATAWMFARADNSTNPNRAWLGIGTGTNGGTIDGADWLGGPTNGGDIDIRIILDTTGGAGTWTATWFARRPTDTTYTVVRPKTPMLTETMNSVGPALAGGTVTGTVQSFSLQAVPEPATMGFLALGGLGLLRRRRNG